MKTGTITLGNASIHAGYSTLIDPTLRGFARELTALSVPEEHRGKGEATNLMKDVCAKADESNLMLFLTADTPKLALFYGRFGFEPIQDEPIVMARAPGGAKLVY